MKPFISSIILILFLYKDAFTQEKIIPTDSIQPSFELKEDDATLAVIDSILANKYFESLGFNDNIKELNIHNYDKDSVPSFDSLTYANRFKTLNANSPFSLVYNNYIKDYINLYAKRRKKITGRMLGLAPYYFPIFEEALDKYDLPLELKYLAIVESALNPNAKSRVGATGLWQFMYRTGKIYGLHVTSYYDERRDVYKSTDAACRYLKVLYNMYNDWDLALAAYNSGPGNVNKAIRRSGGKRSYWEIRPFLPRETRSYVPAFVAVNYIMNYAAEHNIYPIKPNIQLFHTDTIQVKEHVSFSQISELLDIPLETIKYLNPTYKHNFIPNTGKAKTLCLPTNKIGDFLTNESTIYAYKTAKDIKDSIAVAQNKSLSTGKGEQIIYRVRSGDVLGTIAERYNCRVSQLKDWNNLYSDRLKIGQKLYIYSTPSYLAKKKINSTKKKTTLKTTSDDKYIYYTIQKGDNLWDIANKYKGVNVEQLLELNKGVNFKRLKLGTQLKIRPVS